MNPGGKLTGRVLTHILMWADHCSKCPDYDYRKWDANIALVVKDEIKRLNHKNYAVRKENGEYLVPYHLS